MSTNEFTVADLKLLDEAGALDWTLAPTLAFQSYIRRYATVEQECRLANLGVSYIMSERACAWRLQQMRESGKLQEFQHRLAARLGDPEGCRVAAQILLFP